VSLDRQFLLSSNLPVAADGGHRRADMTATIPFRERVSCTIAEACQASGLGRSKLYEEIAAGRVKTTKIGRRTLIIVPSLLQLIEPAASAAAA
jgi:hypothetical protein